MKRLFACALLLVVAGALPAAAQARRSVQSLQLRAELQGELALQNGDYLLATLRGENTPAYNNRSDYRPNRVLGFDTRALAVAYEHFWSPHWSGGAGVEVASASGFQYALPQGLLRHRGALGPLTFGQRLSFARTIPFGNGGRVEGEGQNVADLRVDLEKLLPLSGGRVALRPRLSYEAAARVRLQKDRFAADERTIQYTSLRGEVGIRVGDHFDFTPWVAYTTAYFFTLEQFNPVGGTTTGGGRLNLVTPVVGLDARFTLFGGNTAPERQQLPTQH